MCVGMWLLCWEGMSWCWWRSLGRISGCCSCTASWPLNQQPQVTSIHLQTIYNRSDSKGENPGTMQVSYMSPAQGTCCWWLLREWQYPPLCGDNIHPCVGTICTPVCGQYPPLHRHRGHVAGVWCGWREWHVVVWHNVPPVSPHHTVTALWATWQHHHTSGCTEAEQSMQKNSKSSGRIR